MELRDSVIVVTGAASGIGRALATRFIAEGARGVAVVDLDADGAARVATDLGERALALTANVAVEADIVHHAARGSQKSRHARKQHKVCCARA